jgi:hypothetical protein
MSLKIKCIYYDTVRLSTFHDLEVFSDELRVLLVSGYNITLDVSATHHLPKDPWGTLKPPTFSKTKFDFDEKEPFSSYNMNTAAGTSVKIECENV